MYERGAKCNKPGRSYPGKYSHPKRRSCLLLVSLLVNLVNLSLSSPIYSQQFANFQTGRNIRHLPCVARKTGLKGICMFAIDCLKSNGTHLGTCIDKFYFGSCCQLQPDEDSVFQHEITDNSIDQSVLSTLLHTSPARPLIPVSTISVPARRNSTEPSVPSTVESTTRKTSNSSFTTENIRLSTFQMVEVAPKSTTPKSRPSTLSDLPSSSLPQSSSTLTTRGQPQTTKYSAKPSVDTRPTKPQTTPEKPRPTLSATTHSLPTTYRNLTNRATTKAPRPKPRPTAEIAIVPPSTLADLEFTTVQFVSSSAKTTPSPMSILNSTSWSTNPSPSPTRRTTNKRVPSSTAPSIARTTPKETEPSTAYWTTLGSSLSTNRLTQRTTETPKTTQKTAAPTKPPPTTTRVKTTPSGSTIFVKVETTSPRRPVTTTKVPTTVILKDSSPYSSSTFAKKPATATIERVTTTPKPRPKPTKLQDFKVTTAKPTKAAATSPVVRTTTPKPKPPATTSTTQAAKTTVTEAPLTSKAPEKPPTTVSTSQKPEFVTWTMLDDSTEPAPEAVNWVLVSGEPTQTSTKPTQPSTKPTQPSAKPIQSSTQPTQTSTRSTTAATTTTQSSTTTTTSTAAPTTTPKTTRRTTAATTTTKRPTTTPTTTQSTTRRTTTSTTTSTTPPTTTTTTSTLPPTTTKRVSAPIVEDTATPILLLQDSSEESYTTERIIGTSTSTSIQVNPVPHTTDPTVAATEEHTQNVTAGETVEFSTENLFEYNATIPSLVSLFNSTVAPEFLTPSTTSMPQLEGIDYRTICGKRMFPEPRIVGGAKASFGRWPWQISLRQWRTSTYLHKCGAALLNENWAITAAHCVDNVPPSDLLLRLGEYDLAIEEEPYGYQERRVQIVASHPQFDPRTFEYDLALLRFYEPVIFQPNIIPVCVPENDENFIGRSAYVTGWGRLYEDGPLPSVLQEVTVPVIENSICEGMYRAAGYIEHIPHIFICAGWKKGGFDSCEGDSGGPMVIQRPDKRFLLAGIISWGIGCAEPNQPGVYTRISEFRDWINQILQF